MLAGKHPSPETDEGRSDQKAADLVGIGRTSVASAKAIQQRDPEIINRMRRCGTNFHNGGRRGFLDELDIDPERRKTAINRWRERQWTVEKLIIASRGAVPTGMMQVSAGAARMPATARLSDSVPNVVPD